MSGEHKAVEPLQATSKSGKPRDLALRNAAHVQKYIVGQSGLDLLAHRKNRLLDTRTIVRVRKWLSSAETSQILWVCGPSDARNEFSATGSSLVVMNAAMRIEEPFISHFCSLPRLNEREEGKKVQNAGLIGLMYSLIYQLLQFNVEDDCWELSSGQLEKLDGSEESWPKGILLLDELLSHTPRLSYCIINGINRLEVAGGSERCSQLIDLLLKHQKRAEHPFSILFATAGQSRLLSARTQSRDRHIVVQGATNAHQMGKLLDFSPIAQSKREES